MNQLDVPLVQAVGMVKKAAFGLGLLGFVVFAGGVAADEYDARVDRTFTYAGGLKVEGLGACSYSADEFQCWDMDGVADKALTDRMRSYFLGSTNNQDLPTTFGKKNRLLVVRKSPGNESVNLSGPGNRYNQTGQTGYSNGEPLYQWMHVGFDHAEKTSDLVLSVYNIQGPAAITVPFKDGEKATYDGAAIELGGWKAAPDQAPENRGYYMPTPPGPPAKGGSKEKLEKRWAVYVSSSQNGPYRNLTLTPLRGDGAAINYVDGKGNPISDLEYMKSTKPAVPNPGGFFSPNMGPISTKGYHQVIIRSTGVTAGIATEYTTNLNPNAISSLKISGTRTLKVLLTGFPLDPK